MKVDKKSIINSWGDSVNQLEFYSLLHKNETLSIFGHDAYVKLIHHRINWDEARVCVCVCVFYFEIIMESQKIAKKCTGMSYVCITQPSPVLTSCLTVEKTRKLTLIHYTVYPDFSS